MGNSNEMIVQVLGKYMIIWHWDPEGLSQEVIAESSGYKHISSVFPICLAGVSLNPKPRIEQGKLGFLFGSSWLVIPG